MLTNPGLENQQQGSYIRKTAWGWYLLCSTCRYSSEYCSSDKGLWRHYTHQRFILLHRHYTKGCSEIQSLLSTADETFSSRAHTHFNSILRNVFHVEDVFIYFLRILRSNEFRRFCHKPDCFSTHAVIVSTSTFHLPPQTRCSPCISNPLCMLHKICLLLSIRNEIRIESPCLQAKILLTPNHHEGVLRDVEVKLRILSLDTMAGCAVCFTLLLRTRGGPHAYSWLQTWRDTRASLWMMAIKKKPK
jgi:hypothetical protein